MTVAEEADPLSTKASRRQDESRTVVLGGHDRPPPQLMPQDGSTLPQPFLKPRPPAPGPQLWAVVLTCIGLYYLWTRILGRSMPANFVRGLGQRLVFKKKNDNVRHSEMVAAREKQQRQLQEVANSSTIRERSSVATASSSSPS